MCQNHLEFGLSELQGPLSPKEIILLNLLLKLSIDFWFRLEENKCTITKYPPNHSKSKKTFNSQLPNKLLNEFIKTWFVLSVLKQFLLHLGRFLNSSVLLTKSIPFWYFILPFFAKSGHTLDHTTMQLYLNNLSSFLHLTSCFCLHVVVVLTNNQLVCYTII